jgi:hypothetical protein
MTALVKAMRPVTKVQRSESPAPSAQADDLPGEEGAQRVARPRGSEQQRVARQGGSEQQQIAFWRTLASELRERADRGRIGHHGDLWHVSHVMLAAAAKLRLADNTTLARALLDVFDAAAKLVSALVTHLPSGPKLP